MHAAGNQQPTLLNRKLYEASGGQPQRMMRTADFSTALIFGGLRRRFGAVLFGSNEVRFVDHIDLRLRRHAWLNRSSRRHRSMNLRQVARIAGPLSFLKSAMVLKSGASRPVSHISSTLRWASAPAGGSRRSG